MNSRILLAGFFLFFSCHEPALAQRFATVQLPTYQRFSISTSVLVPDRGSTYAGGVNGSYRSSSRFGNPVFPTTRSTSGGGSASGVSVSAYIHDFEAMDAAVLAEGRRLRFGTAGRPMLKTDRSLRARQFSMPKISEVRAQTQTAERVRIARARTDYELAQKLLAKGRIKPARILLLNAQKRANRELQVRVAEQLAELDRIPPTARIAAR